MHFVFLPSEVFVCVSKVKKKHIGENSLSSVNNHRSIAAGKLLLGKVSTLEEPRTRFSYSRSVARRRMEERNSFSL